MKKVFVIIGKEVGVILLLLLLLQPSVVYPRPTPDFPIGVTLVYEAEDDYFMSQTLYSTESFTFLNWLAPDNSSFQLQREYTQGDYTVSSIRNVSYPSWNYTVYIEEFNGTDESAMYPLWVDVTDWQLGDNISIGRGNYDVRNYTITHNEIVRVDEVPVYCWVVECEYVNTNDWDITVRNYYDTSYGVLIKHYYHRYPHDIDDIRNIGTFTDILVASNILDELESLDPLHHGFNLTNFLIVGIMIEFIIVVALLVRRTMPVQSGTPPTSQDYVT